jgi:uncharacterized protein (DUF983 family)
LVLFSGALSLQCPLCGSGGLFDSWFVMKERCPRCRLLLGRGKPGHELVATTINLTIPFLVWTWPDPPWTFLLSASVVLMIGLPLLHYPLAHTLAVALSVFFHPPTRWARS